MKTLPYPVHDLLLKAVVDPLNPACLQVAPTGELIHADGCLAAYGLYHLVPGTIITEILDVLEGMFPLSSEKLVLHNVQISDVVCADIHLFDREGTAWILLLDSAGEADRQRQVQQHRQDASLLRDRMRRLTSQDLPLAATEEPIRAHLLACQDTLVLERIRDRDFVIAGPVPHRFRNLLPSELLDGGRFNPSAPYPFIEEFLTEAEALWRSGAPDQLRAGPWTELSPDGLDHQLEVSAVRVGCHEFILIRLLDIEFSQRTHLLQKARELSLDFEKLLKEINEKEILLHCIVHDLSGPLTGIRGCLEMLESENLSVGGRRLSALGLKEVQRQETLIRQMLEVFAADVRALQSPPDIARAPDIVHCAHAVLRGLSGAFKTRGIRFHLREPADSTDGFRVVAEAVKLERIFYNLFENAIRHTRHGNSVNVRFESSPEGITTFVENEGEPIPQHLIPDLFRQFVKGDANSGKSGLGLFFCRITVERWGGRIGYEPLPEGGVRFWFRLLRI